MENRTTNTMNYKFTRLFKRGAKKIPQMFY